jgi:hypothetical protein
MGSAGGAEGASIAGAIQRAGLMLSTSIGCCLVSAKPLKMLATKIRTIKGNVGTNLSRSHDLTAAESLSDRLGGALVTDKTHKPRMAIPFSAQNLKNFSEPLSKSV